MTFSITGRRWVGPDAARDRAADALVQACDLPRAVALANVAAGIVVGKLGTATVTVPEIRRALHEQDDSLQGVVSEEQLMIAIEDARAHRERIVFTNGCFDVLHRGHAPRVLQVDNRADVQAAGAWMGVVGILCP